MTSEHALFREQAVEACQNHYLGKIRLATPISHAIWTLSALAIAAAIVVWLLMGHYTRRERVSGRLVPQAGLINLTASTAGSVMDLAVHEGERVHAGQALMTISSERVSASMGDTAADISTQLRAQRTRLLADLANVQDLADEQAKGLRAQQRTLKMQLHQLDGQRSIQLQQVESARSLLKTIKPLLAKGYVSAFQVRRRQEVVLNAEAQARALAGQRAHIRQQLVDSRNQLRQVPLKTRIKRNDLRRKLAQVEQTLAQNEATRTSVLRSPQPGIVSSLIVEHGQSVKPGQVVLTVVPSGSPLEAQLLVPSSAIGFLRRGESVSLRYQAFPYQKFGLQHGRVTQVSHNALSPTEIAVMVGREPHEPLYRVNVDLEHQYLMAYGKPHSLKAGMQLSADVLLDRRRLFEWIFEPMFGMGDRIEGAH